MAKFDKSMEYISQTQTLIGQQRKRLVDQDTGEVIEVDQITKRALGQKQFWKIYLMDFLQVLGGFEYKQLDVLIYILEHTEAANNTFIGTYRSLEKNVGVSYDTVRRTITLLQGKGFLKKVSNGVYQVSPTIMMKGSEHKKSLLLITSTTKSKSRNWKGKCLPKNCKSVIARRFYGLNGVPCHPAKAKAQIIYGERELRRQLPLFYLYLSRPRS